MILPGEEIRARMIELATAQGATVDEVMARDRRRHVVLARKNVIHFLRDRGWSFIRIGVRMDRHWSTVRDLHHRPMAG